MNDNKAVDEQNNEPEIRGGDRPADYIAEAPLPKVPVWPLRADAAEAEEDLHDDES